MQLRNVNIVGNEDEHPQNIQVVDRKITTVSVNEKYPVEFADETVLNFENVIAFPGIN